MARKAQPVTLSSNEIRSLKNILTRGTSSARTLSRARVLDLLHRQKQPADVAALLHISPQTVYNVKRRYLEGGLQLAMFDQPALDGPSNSTASNGLGSLPWLVARPQKGGRVGLCACLQTKLLNWATANACRTPPQERF
jgi:hypothetical protein